jgi:Protein of unknown function (DUF3455)
MTQSFLSVSLIIALISMSNLDRVLVASPQKIAQTENSKTSFQIPELLKVPSNQSLVFKATAKGVQVYICKAKAKSKTDFEWTLKAPSADLFNDQGLRLGKHYAGPTWELQEDGSKVVGVVSAKVNAPQNDAIPLLLLKAKSQQGKGILGSVSWIQRLDTLGGKPPITGCDRTRQTAEVQVTYTASYYFYRAAKPESLPSIKATSSS